MFVSTLLIRPLIDFRNASHVIRWYSLLDLSLILAAICANLCGGIYKPVVGFAGAAAAAGAVVAGGDRDRFRVSSINYLQESSENLCAEQQRNPAT